MLILPKRDPLIRGGVRHKRIAPLGGLGGGFLLTGSLSDAIAAYSWRDLFGTDPDIIGTRLEGGGFGTTLKPSTKDALLVSESAGGDLKARLWIDQTGNGNSLTCSPEFPVASSGTPVTYDGKNSLYTPSQQYMRRDTFTWGLENNTVVAVFDYTTQTFGAIWRANVATTSSGTHGIQSTNPLRLNYNSHEAIGYGPASAWQVAVFQHTASTGAVKLWINGNLVVDETGYRVSAMDTGLTLCKRGGTGAEFTVVNWAELIVFDRLISDSERATIEANIKTEYGIS